MLTFYKNNGCTGEIVIELENDPITLRAEDQVFADDKASSLKLVGVPKNTYIAVYDNQDAHTNDDWAEIWVLQDIKTSYCLSTFEQTHVDEFVAVYYYPHNGLDSDVSRIQVSKQGNPHGQLLFFSDNDCGGKPVMAFRDTPLHTYRKGDANFKNDAVSSVRLTNVDAGTVITIYDHPNAKESDDWVEIKVLKKVESYDIGTFEKSFSDDVVEVTFHEYNGLDGKVSHIHVVKQ